MLKGSILEAIEVTSTEMPIEEARKLGAMALFGEKYGDIVRVVKASDFSVEFCGGTHVNNTSKLGLFHIRSEASAAAGVRRIEAVTGTGVLEYLGSRIGIIHDSAAALKIPNPWELAKGCEKTAEALHEKDRKIEELNSKLASGMVDRIIASEKKAGSISVFTGVLDDANADMLRNVCDKIIGKYDQAVVVLAGKTGGKGTFAAACTKSAVKAGIKAGAVAKAVAQLTGGNGGGKPEMAMAGAKDISKIDSALAEAVSIVENML